MPGVVCVLTAADLADLDPYWGHAIRDRPVVAIDRVRFAGEPVAAVAAEDEATAAAALERIVVDYEELEVVGTIEQALAPNAPIVNEGPLRPGLFHGLGELAPADGQRLLPLPHRSRRDRGCLRATPTSSSRASTPFPPSTSTRWRRTPSSRRSKRARSRSGPLASIPFLVRAEIAALFEVPISNVRVVVPYLGGGFGSKSYTKMEPITVALARKAGRPVRIQNRSRSRW